MPSSLAKKWGAFRKYKDFLEKYGRKSYQKMQTANLLTTQAKEVKSSFAEAEQNLLLIYTLQEAKPKKHSEHLQVFLCWVLFFFFNSAESHIKNKTRRAGEEEGMHPASCFAHCARCSRGRVPREPNTHQHRAPASTR